MYYMSALFSHLIIIQIALDNEPTVFLNLTSPKWGVHNQVVSSAVVWGKTELVNTQHVLTVSMAPGGRNVEVDAFM